MSYPDQYRTFSELKLGDRFISPPFPGDNAGHGGLRGATYIFVKAGVRTSIRLCDGIKSDSPPTMYVLEVL